MYRRVVMMPPSSLNSPGTSSTRTDSRAARRGGARRGPSPGTRPASPGESRRPLRAEVLAGPSGMQSTRRRYSGPINVVVAADVDQPFERRWRDDNGGAPSPTCLQDWGALQSTGEHSRPQRIDHRATIFWAVTTKVTRHQPVSVQQRRVRLPSPPPF